ncbi:peptide chain release factor N(5)-glutamine methyltransferase [Marinobacter sp.]|uniref:peptide chain release factor N(5)-glutamine methyltransferase n=1 Tax=Marinobacter sp. TaxID=50741 RepID=UPI00384D40B8
MSESSLTCEQLIRKAVARIDSETPRLDVELIMESVTGWSRTSLRAWPERTLSDEQLAEFGHRVAQRAAGRPIAHILGEQAFWSLPLMVSDATLIPRPDTERLVETALDLPLAADARVLDLGTGTGAIALALASEKPTWQIVACDAVPAAVELARANARRLELLLEVTRSHWFDDLPPGRFDLIVSNPPYIAADDRHLREGDVRFEPATALVAGVEGLDDLRHIICEAPGWLSSGGWLLVEHGYDQGSAVRELFEAAGLVDVSTIRDYGGQPRLTRGRLPLS